MNNVTDYKKVTTVNKNGIEFELCAYNFVEPENYLWNSNSCSKRYKPSKLSIFSPVKVNQKKSNISKIFLQDYTITAMLSLVDKIHVTEPNSNTKFIRWYCYNREGAQYVCLPVIGRLILYQSYLAFVV